MQLDAIRLLIQSDLNAADQLIYQQLNSSIPLINQVSRHLISSGGKRLRPIVVLLGAKLFGYSGALHIDLAAIIELIHTATLLHDDVVDASTLRRNRETANAIWGNSASVLVGDYLYSRAFQMMVGTKNIPVLETLAKTTNVIVEGEVLQLSHRNNPDTTENDYMQIIHHKTGVLFAAAAQLGAILCERPQHEVDAIANYGMHLGTAFQLIDDVLDYKADTDLLGKHIGDDLAEGKPTLPLIYALHHSQGQQANFIRSAIQNGTHEYLPEILIAIESTQALEYTYQVAKQQADRATHYLKSIPESPYRDALHALAHFAVTRQY